MKKNTVLGTVIVMCGLFASSVLGYECDVTPSDEDLVMNYAIEEHGEGNYDVVIFDDTDDEYISYMVYEDGNPHWTGTIKRSYAINCFNK